MLPLLRQERDEAGILSKVIQIGITLEQRLAREPVLSRHPQPLDCLLRFFHERKSTGDVIGRHVLRVVFLRTAQPWPEPGHRRRHSLRYSLTRR